MPSSSSLPSNIVYSSAVRRVLLLALLVLAVSLDTAQAQNPTASPSLAPSTFPSASPTITSWGECDDGGGSNKVTIGEETTACIQIGNGDNWAAGVDSIHYNLKPKVDEFNRLRFLIPISYVDFVGNPNTDPRFRSSNITIGITSQDQLSYLRRYYDFELLRIYPYLTAIINVKAGEVTGITWDDACEFCDSDMCEENTVDINGVEVTQKASRQPTKACYFTQEECNSLVAEYARNDCDMVVYVVWSGTDSNGKTFESAGNGQSGGMTLVVVAMTFALVGAGWL